VNKIVFLLIICPVLAHTRNDRTKLVAIQKINPNIIVELVYASPHNFTKQRVYEAEICCVLEEVALQLDAVQKELECMISKKHPQGLCLKIWDGYRPLSAQKKMWQACAQQYPDEKERAHYVANPALDGGRHTRGTSVDVTLIDRATGNELEMGSAFDDFSRKSHRNYPGLSQEVRYNRTLLETVMARHNFKSINSEWWHFDYYTWQDHVPLDIPLCQLVWAVS
jgi:D-alanyl-D-alanine dipeptidase